MKKTANDYRTALFAMFVLLAWPGDAIASPPAEPHVPPTSAVSITGYWAKAVAIAEAKEESYLSGCDGSVDNYTVSVWADQRYYYVRFTRKPGTNGNYPTDYVEDVVSKNTFDIVRDFKY
jgi:hypothetical protein